MKACCVSSSARPTSPARASRYEYTRGRVRAYQPWNASSVDRASSSSLPAGRAAAWAVTDVSTVQVRDTGAASSVVPDASGHVDDQLRDLVAGVDEERAVRGPESDLGERWLDLAPVPELVVGKLLGQLIAAPCRHHARLVAGGDGRARLDDAIGKVHRRHDRDLQGLRERVELRHDLRLHVLRLGIAFERGLTVACRTPDAETLEHEIGREVGVEDDEAGGVRRTLERLRERDRPTE